MWYGTMVMRKVHWVVRWWRYDVVIERGNEVMLMGAAMVARKL